MSDEPPVLSYSVGRRRRASAHGAFGWAVLGIGFAMWAAAGLLVVVVVWVFLNGSAN